MPQIFLILQDATGYPRSPILFSATPRPEGTVSLSSGLRQCPMMKLSSDNGSITSRRVAARRLSVPYREPRRVPLAQVKQRGEGRTAPYTYHGDCLCWLMATYAAHTSHYEAVLGASPGPLLSPWPGHRRVMANALRIKCILSPTARWHRCLGNIEITPSSLRFDTSSFLVAGSSLSSSSQISIDSIVAGRA